jgi:hypothetical protein
MEWKRKKRFEHLKKIMSSTPVLETLEFIKPLVVECDASRFGISIVFMQEDHSIAFKIQKLNKREILKSTNDKNMFAIIHTLAKWQQYLLGSKSLICTNHNSL